MSRPKYFVAAGGALAIGILLLLVEWRTAEVSDPLARITSDSSHLEQDEAALRRPQTPSPANPSRPSTRAAEDELAQAQLMESGMSWQSNLPVSRLKELASEGDLVATEILAGELAEESPDEALVYAAMAAQGGRPAAAVLAADILATSKNDPAEGLLLLDTFEENHGRSPLVSAVRNRYARMHAVSEAKILSDYRLLKTNKLRGSPQKYPLTAPTQLTAPAHPAPP